MLSLVAFVKSPQPKVTSLPTRNGPSEPSSDEKTVVDLSKKETCLEFVQSRQFGTLIGAVWSSLIDAKTPCPGPAVKSSLPRGCVEGQG